MSPYGDSRLDWGRRCFQYCHHTRGDPSNPSYDRTWRTRTAMPAFCIAVSRETAMICFVLRPAIQAIRLPAAYLDCSLHQCQVLSNPKSYYWYPPFPLRKNPSKIGPKTVFFRQKNAVFGEKNFRFWSRPVREGGGGVPPFSVNFFR